MAKPRFGPSIPSELRKLGIGFNRPLGPTADAAGGARTGGGVVIVRTHAKSALDQVRALQARVPPDLLKQHEAFATRLQNRLRAVTLAAYGKTGTGRFSRGLFARVKPYKDGAAVIVTMVNYRESRFLTNLGGGRSFKARPYRIFAKGVDEFLASPELGGTFKGSQAYGKRLTAGEGVGRLKVPRSGFVFEGFRKPGRGGGESRRIANPEIDIGSPLSGTPGAYGMKDRSFFYPLWVNHPGFKKDYVSEIVAQEGGRYVADVRALMEFEHQNLGGGQFVSTPRGLSKSGEAVVSNIIPLPDPGIRLSRGAYTKYSGSFRPVPQSSARISRVTDSGERFKLR